MNNNRILPNRSKAKAIKVSHEEVTAAIMAFKKNGGLINQLPPQPGNKRNHVGNRWGSAYETLFEH